MRYWGDVSSCAGFDLHGRWLSIEQDDVSPGLSLRKHTCVERAHVLPWNSLVLSQSVFAFHARVICDQDLDLCVFICVWYLCVCVRQTKLSGRNPPSLLLHMLLYIARRPPPSSVAVKCFYNLHSSCTNTLDCLSFNGCIHLSFPSFSGAIHPSLFHTASLPLSGCRF